MLKWAKRICHLANLSESGLMVGDPYSGTRAGRQSGGETGQEVKQLAAQLDELQRKFDRCSGGSDRGGRLRDQGTTSSEEQSDGGRG